MPGETNAAEVRAVRAVAMGGGTGLSTLLHGLKKHVAPANDGDAAGLPVIAELSAIVTVSDDGGSSGRLRKELNLPAPGDIRNCIVALSEEEALLSRLFQYRFPAGEGLSGHNFGNLFLSAMTAITGGDFSQAVEQSSAILATRGHIYPATTANAQLYAIMDDDSIVRGETNITASDRRIVELRMEPDNAPPLPAAMEAIHSADLITIGPGSLFTSLAPNLLVRDVARAIAESHAVKVFVCNLMTQANESLGLTAADHIRALYKHARHEFFDYALVNRTPASAELARKYAEQGQSQIEADVDQIEKLGVTAVLGDYLVEAARASEGLIARHETNRVAQDLLRLMVEAPAREGSAVPAARP
jgi:uncharacterized cofD-like protein